MKKTFFSFILLIVGVCSLAMILDGQAWAGDGDQPIEETVDYTAGVWREGKAVDTDWVALDFLMKDYLRRGYAPKQPIQYSHALHVGKLGLECQYCHSGVAKSPYATLPAVETCMGCHSVVKEVVRDGVKTESEEIKKLTKYYEEKTPIPWEPVNNLPEHVNFNHKRHVKAGVSCQNCHGVVQKMEVVEKVSSLKMGFCVSCHRENGASIDCGVCHY